MTSAFADSTNIIAILFLQFLLLAAGDESLARVKRDDKLKVTTLMSTPYYMAKQGGGYEGYIVDLLEKVKEKTNLTFEIHLVADQKYGMLDSNGNWNGMVGEVVDGKAAIAAAPLTVTEQRKTVLDYTIPFMTLNLSIVLLKPKGDMKIHNVKDLTEQTDIKCGVIKGGSTSMFLNSSQDPIISKLNLMVNSDPNNLVMNYEQGIEKVRASGGNFGMIIESVIADYHIGQIPCDLIGIGVGSEDRSYALAVKKGSRLKHTLDNALEQLKVGAQDSELERLKQKWWKSKCSSASLACVEFQSLIVLMVVFLFSLIGSV